MGGGGDVPVVARNSFETVEIVVYQLNGGGGASRLKKGRGASARTGRRGDDFLSRQPRLPAKERFDDLEVRFGMPVGRGVEIVELVAQLAVGGKEKFVDVLRQRKVFSEKTPIVRNSAKDHVGLGDVFARHVQSKTLRELLAFGERERLELNPVGDASVEALGVLEQVLDDPGRGRTADNQKDVALPSCGDHRVPDFVQVHA